MQTSTAQSLPPSRFPFTVTTIGKIPLVVKEQEGRAQRLYFDTERPGFGLCVGAKAKTFFYQRDVDGKSVRTTIGRFGTEYTLKLNRPGFRGGQLV